MVDMILEPGFLYPLATFLPLLAFIALFLWCGLWAFLRPFPANSSCHRLFLYLGGDHPGLTPALISTIALSLAFTASLAGMVVYGSRYHQDQLTLEKIDQSIARIWKEISLKDKDQAWIHERKELLKQEESARERIVSRWKRSFSILRIDTTGQNNPEHSRSLMAGYSIDGLTALLFLVVTGIGTLVHVYSIGYMEKERGETVTDPEVSTSKGFLVRRGRWGRYFLYLPLFCFAMLNIIIADNLFQVFIGWELVGICSYFLIGFYYERKKAASAATRAFLTNRVSDAGFILAMAIIWTYLGTFQFESIFTRLRSPHFDRDGELALAGRMVRRDMIKPSEGDQPAVLAFIPTGENSNPLQEIDSPRGDHVILFPQYRDEHFHGVKPGEEVKAGNSPEKGEYGAMPTWALILAGLGLLTGCMGKSAQFPFHVWLPGAMEGPTPVSALIHAATMVAAGVYLAGRCYPLFTPEVLLVMAYVGAISLFLGATVALTVTDIKQVLAWSTISQLGYMMLAMGVGGWVPALFHLVTHAIFKSLLFLGAGSVIHACGGVQEMTRMGGLFSKLRMTALTMLAGSMAIAGVPFFVGWYSKDSIMAHAFAYTWNYPDHWLLFALPLVTSGLTAFYMLRLWLMTFAGRPRDQAIHLHAHESPPIMVIPLVLLAVLSVVTAWGWPVWDSQSSLIASFLNQTRPEAVHYDFGHVLEEGELLKAGIESNEKGNVRLTAYQFHHVVGNYALLMAGIGMVFAMVLFGIWMTRDDFNFTVFPGVAAFLQNGLRLDQLYEAILVKPLLRLSLLVNTIDQSLIDGLVHGLAPVTLGLANLDKTIEKGIVDPFVMRVAGLIYGAGSRIRLVQNGLIRKYILFLVFSALGIFIILSYLVTQAVNGS